MKVQLSNGLIVEGTVKQIVETVKALGLPDKVGPTYQSKSMGEILISDMNDSHVRRAILKRMRTWVENLANSTDEEVLQALTHFTLDSEFINLKAEFSRRLATRGNYDDPYLTADSGDWLSDLIKPPWR